MPTRNVVLTDHQSRLVDSLVESRRDQNASEVLREGLRLGEAQEAEDAARLEVPRAAARTGTEAFDRGGFKVFESARALTDHLDRIASAAIEAK